METKICTKCYEEKLLEEFSKDSKRPGGKLSSCKSCYSLYFKAYREKKKKDLDIKHKKWLEDNPSYFEELRASSEYKAKRKQYYFKNKQKLNRDNKEMVNNKYHSDSIFRLKRRICNNIRGSFKRALNGIHVKKSTSLDILGCSMDKFVKYISAQFTEGMSLENQGEWHLDHIIPISSANSKEEIYRLCHYTNYQPLWAEDNLKKGAKIIK